MNDSTIRSRAGWYPKVCIWWSIAALLAMAAGTIGRLMFFDWDTSAAELIALGTPIVLTIAYVLFTDIRGGHRHKADIRLVGCSFLLSCFGLFVLASQPALLMVWTAANNMQAASNLHRVAVAMYEYDADHGHLPPIASRGKDGQLLLSWRVLILPQLGEKERELYAAFRLDEPWDSSHNFKLLSQMPEVYLPARGARRGANSTMCKLIVGPGAVFDGQRNLSLRRIESADGLPDTILLVSAGEPVPWTKPVDLTFDENQPMPMRGDKRNSEQGGKVSGFHVATADCRVHSLRTPTTDKAQSSLRSLITWNGGESVNWDDVDE